MKHGNCSRAWATFVGLALVSFTLLPSCASIADKSDSFHYNGVSKRLFKPSGRVFFDTGTDDDGEVDVFKDGSLTAAISLVEMFGAFSDADTADLKDTSKSDASWNWRFGPTLGFGITSPADDSDDGSKNASGAPVVLLTGGLLLEFPIVKDSRSIVGVEFGYAQGFSAAEGLEDKDDGAIYVGITIDIPWN